MSFKAAAGNIGASDTVSVNVSSLSITNGDWVVIAVEEYTSGVSAWPSGFSTNIRANCTSGSFGRASGFSVAWKQANNEPSTYTINIAGGNGDPPKAIVGVWSGRTTPIANSVTTPSAGEGNSPVTINAKGYTANSGDDVACFILVASSTTNAWSISSPPTNYTSANTQIGSGAFFGGCLNLSYRNNVSAGATGNLVATATATGADAVTATVVLGLSSGTTPTLFKMYSNGAFQAHAFVQASLPANTALKLYGANNTVHCANLVQNGGGKIKLYSNGQLIVNNTIIV